jgi:hypothetical protein
LSNGDKTYAAKLNPRLIAPRIKVARLELSAVK